MTTVKTFTAILILVGLASAYSVLYEKNKKTEYLNAIGLGKEYAITNIDTAGNYIAVGVSDGTSAAGYFLERNGRHYSVLAGPLQEEPSCSLMQSVHIPRELYASCY